jgi:Lon protease-like protein
MTGDRQGSDAMELAMFPLSVVLLPHEKLPLHVFEERYRTMIADCLAADSRFGVVLIARGPEVGGGDTRHDVGTVAEIEIASPTPDGRYGILACGTTRLSVKEWILDAAYPKAVVEIVSEPVEEDLSVEVASALSELRVVRELWEALGEGLALPDEVQLGADFTEQVWRLCSATPLGALDRQLLLEEHSASSRLSRLGRLIEEQRQDFVAMLHQRED